MLNMDNTMCESSKEDQLYVLEVFVDRVTLYAERLEKIDPNALGTDLSIADFPLFRVFQTDFELTKQERRKQIIREGEYRVVNFNAGKMYLSSQNPSELIRKIRSSPLLVDVYKIKSILNCPYEVLKEPLGEASIPFPGCLCDQVMMAENDAYHLPKSYEIKNKFGLIDKDQRPSGFVTLFIRLTCFSQCIMTKYSLMDKKLLFKNDGSGNEFLCTKVPLLDENERRAAEEGAKTCLPGQVFEESELDAPPRSLNTTGLALVCKELSKRDGYPPELKSLPEKQLLEKMRSLDKPEEVVQRKEQLEKLRNSDCLHHESSLQKRFRGKQGPCIFTGCSGVCTGQK